MSQLIAPKMVKWPFFMGDALLVALAWVFYRYADLPFDGPTLAGCLACVTLGALLGIAPFIIDYRAELRLAESNGLVTVTEKIDGLEQVAEAVANATSQWQSVHEHATQTTTAARQIADKMNDEMKSFMEFFEKANQSEKQHLSLEVEKLKRAESDWLTVIVTVLDHLYAINAAARKSGQPRVSEQLQQLQQACRDAARRVGLTALEVEPGTPFDPDLHTLPPGGEASEGARVAEAMATGYAFRGQRIRPALVALEGAPGVPEAASEPEPAPDQEGQSPDAPPTEQELSL